MLLLPLVDVSASFILPSFWGPTFLAPPPHNLPHPHPFPPLEGEGIFQLAAMPFVGEREGKVHLCRHPQNTCPLDLPFF